MPQQVVLDDLPLGFCVVAARESETVSVQVRGSAFSEDGTKLNKWLESMVSPILAKLSPRVWPHQVHHLVALIQKDKTATVFINEVKFLGQVRTKGAVKAGEPVFIDHVADFGRLRMESIEVPPDVGVVVVMSSGWRRAVFYDLGPVGGQPRETDLEATLGAFWGYLAFEDRAHMDDEQWAALVAQGWFPFVGLKFAHLERLLGHVSSGWSADEIVPDIAKDLLERSDQLVAHAKRVPAAQGHLATLQATLRHYTAGDYLSAAGLLYPRIEGLLRDNAKLGPGTPKFSQKGLAEAATTDLRDIRLPGSLLLPDRFREYLESVFFKPFDPNKVADTSRNSVSHGVVPETLLNQRAATIALLVFEQLLFLFGTDDKAVELDPAQPAG
jgi:hypothetical protein